MTDNTNPKEYKYKLKADVFVKLFLASDDEFEKIKTYLLNEGEEGVNGIVRTKLFTFLSNVEILGQVNIVDIVKEDCTLLYCTNSKFSDFKISKSILFSNESPILKFKNCVIHDFKIEFSVVKGVVFENRNVINAIDFKRCFLLSFCFKLSNANTFIIYSIVIDSIEIEDSIIKNIQSDLNISRVFKIHNNCKIDTFYSTLGSLANEYKIFDSQIGHFSANKLFSSFSLKNSNISLFNLNDCEINEFSISLSCKMEANISGGSINKINFGKVGLNRETLISFSKVQVYAILMDEFSMLGNLYFRQIIKGKEPFGWWEDFMSNILTPIFDDDTVMERLFQQTEVISKKMKAEYLSEFNNLKKNIESPTIRISQSSLGKTEFTDCPLAYFRFEFNNSKITDCFVSGNSIPTEKVYILRAEPNSIEEYQQKASFFNQFKKIFEAQGDIYHATQFQAKWAEEERKYLRLQRKKEKSDIPPFCKWHSLKQIWKWIIKILRILLSPFKKFGALISQFKIIRKIKRCWCRFKNRAWRKFKINFNPTSNDIFTLWLNKISNLHGESYARTLGVFFGLIIPVIYLILLWSLGRISFRAEFDYNLFWKYFEFLNPAHSMKFIDEECEIKGGAILVDFIGRVFVSYAIYQFIAAFRKHTKK